MIKHALMGAVVVLLSSCAATPDVRTSLSPGADPGRYRTFVFMEGDPKAKGAIADATVRRRLQQLVTGELAGKGYAPPAAGQPGQLGVHIAGHVEPKQRVFIMGRPGPYDYGWGRTEIGGYQTADYREGTLFVDVVDLARGELVWRAHISEALTAGYSDENLKKVDRALEEAFKTFPPRR